MSLELRKRYFSEGKIIPERVDLNIPKIQQVISNGSFSINLEFERRYQESIATGLIWAPHETEAV